VRDWFNEYASEPVVAKAAMTEDQLAGMAVTALAGLYVVPGIIARARKHPRAMTIAALNLFAGWTLVGWIVALVWALMPKPVVDKVLPELAPMRQCTQCGRMQLAHQHACLSCGAPPDPG
jgi:hypothetical protein